MSAGRGLVHGVVAGLACWMLLGVVVHGLVAGQWGIS